MKELPGDSVTVSGTVVAIDHTSRALTLKNEAGELVTLDVSAEVKRFPEIKIGDKISARYYDNVTVRLKKPGEAAVNTASAAVTPGKGAKPGATVATQRTMTAAIEAIDPNVPSISFKGPQGWKYSRKVLDKERTEAGEGRRPGGLHLDRRADRRGDVTEELRRRRRPRLCCWLPSS